MIELKILVRLLLPISQNEKESRVRDILFANRNSTVSVSVNLSIFTFINVKAKERLNKIRNN